MFSSLCWKYLTKTYHYKSLLIFNFIFRGKTYTIDAKGKPASYFSKNLKESQIRVNATYFECFAMKEAVKYFKYCQHWLIEKKNTIYSDHKPLQNLNIRYEELGHLTYYLSTL